MEGVQLLDPFGIHFRIVLDHFFNVSFLQVSRSQLEVFAFLKTCFLTSTTTFLAPASVKRVMEALINSPVHNDALEVIRFYLNPFPCMPVLPFHGVTINERAFAVILLYGKFYETSYRLIPNLGNLFHQLAEGMGSCSIKFHPSFDK